MTETTEKPLFTNEELIIFAAEKRGSQQAYQEVIRLAKAIYANEQNDLSDRHAVMTFAEKFLGKAFQ